MSKSLEEVFELYQNIHYKLSEIKTKSSYPDDDNRKDIFGVLNSQVIFLQTLLHVMDTRRISIQDPSFLNPFQFKAIFGISIFESWLDTEFQIIPKISLMTTWNFLIENFFKSLFLKIDSNYISKGYYSIVQGIITQTEISDPDTKIKTLYTLALYRNALHNQGVHLPSDSRWDDFSIHVKNTVFSFTKGKKIEITFSELAVLLDATIDILDEIINSQKIQDITEKIPLTLSTD